MSWNITDSTALFRPIRENVANQDERVHLSSEGFIYPWGETFVSKKMTDSALVTSRTIFKELCGRVEDFSKNNHLNEEELKGEIVELFGGQEALFIKMRTLTLADVDKINGVGIRMIRQKRETEEKKEPSLYTSF